MYKNQARTGPSRCLGEDILLESDGALPGQSVVGSSEALRRRAVKADGGAEVLIGLGERDDNVLPGVLREGTALSSEALVRGNEPGRIRADVIVGDGRDGAAVDHHLLRDLAGADGVDLEVDLLLVGDSDVGFAGLAVG